MKRARKRAMKRILWNDCVCDGDGSRCRKKKSKISEGCGCEVKRCKCPFDGRWSDFLRNTGVYIYVSRRSSRGPLLVAFPPVQKFAITDKHHSRYSQTQGATKGRILAGQ